MSSLKLSNQSTGVPAININTRLKYESATPLRQSHDSDIALHQLFFVGLGVILAIAVVAVGLIILLSYGH